jgi:hypothetical protein
MNWQVVISTGQLLLASALLEEILFLLKPLLVDSLDKVSPEIWPTALKKPVSEGSFEVENAGTNYSRFVLHYHAGHNLVVFLYV